MVYILNSVPTKSVLNTPVELWTDRKTSVQHYRISRSPEYVFKGKTGNLDTKSEFCYFVGDPKGTKGWLFYDPKNK